MENLGRERTHVKVEALVPEIISIPLILLIAQQIFHRPVEVANLGYLEWDVALAAMGCQVHNHQVQCLIGLLPLDDDERPPTLVAMPSGLWNQDRGFPPAHSGALEDAEPMFVEGFHFGLGRFGGSSAKLDRHSDETARQLAFVQEPEARQPQHQQYRGPVLKKGE